MKTQGRSASEGSYRWGISHRPTVEQIEKHLHSLRARRGLQETTLKSKRSRIARYGRLYESQHGTGNLLQPAAGATISSAAETPRSVGYRRALAVFDILNSECKTDASVGMYWSDINQFYSRLLRWGLIEFNPVDGIPAEYQWDPEEQDNKPLEAEQVSQMHQITRKEENELLVYALAGWGLRPNEVAALSREQVENLSEAQGDPDTYPHIEFEERKNGPGTVTILFGQDALRQRLSRVDSEFVFPSPQLSGNPITKRTVENRFKRIAEAADVYVDGETAKPKMGRRFWYTTYQRVMTEIYEELSIVAAEQGSSSSEVVADNYLSEAARREMRRTRMEERLAEAFSATPN